MNVRGGGALGARGALVSRGGLVSRRVAVVVVGLVALVAVVALVALVRRAARTEQDTTADALADDVDDAFAEAGLRGDVAGVDCAVAPCIVYATVLGSPGTAAQRLARTRALARWATGRTVVVAAARTTGGERAFALAFVDVDVAPRALTARMAAGAAPHGLVLDPAPSPPSAPP
jgi:hypothetical protein